jgi:hypothetical protein
LAQNDTGKAKPEGGTIFHCNLPFCLVYVFFFFYFGGILQWVIGLNYYYAIQLFSIFASGVGEGIMRFCGEEFKGKRTQRKTSFRFPLDCCVSFFFFLVGWVD